VLFRSQSAFSSVSVFSGVIKSFPSSEFWCRRMPSLDVRQKIRDNDGTAFIAPKFTHDSAFFGSSRPPLECDFFVCHFENWRVGAKSVFLPPFLKSRTVRERQRLGVGWCIHSLLVFLFIFVNVVFHNLIILEFLNKRNLLKYTMPNDICLLALLPLSRSCYE